jgi:uncharacterized DUF497 family protein
MDFEFDAAKSERNVALRDLPFDLAPAIFDAPRLEWSDVRKNYGERQINALGVIGERVVFVTYTLRGQRCPIISFRKANEREIDACRQNYP